MAPRMRHLLISCALAGIAIAAPASKPVDKPVRQTVEILTAQGMAALSAQDAKASLDSFLDALQLIKTDKQIPQMDPLRVQTQHGLAVAYLQAQRFDKAGEVFKPGDVLDRVVNTPAAPRAMVYNRALLDLTQKFNIMRSIKSLKEFLTIHPENDEQMLNLFGTLIDRASYDERFSKGALFDQANKFYDAASAKLEQTKDGQRRWGIEWVPEKEYKSRAADRQDFVDIYNKALAKLNAADAEARAAADDVSAQSAKAKFGKPNSLGRAQSRKQRADNTAAEYQKDADEKKAAIPHYPWLTEAAPIIPDGTAAVAVAMNPPKPAPHAVDPKPEKPAKPARNPKKDLTGPVAPPDPVEPPPVAVDPPADPVPATPPKVRVTRYAAAFPIAPDLFITARAAVEKADSISMEDSQGNTFTGEFVRADEKAGLAIVRVAGKQFAFLNLADKFAGGDLRCTGFPTVSIFSPSPETLPGKSGPIKPTDSGNWPLAFTTNPRLPGAPVTTADGSLIGVVMAERDSVPSQTPAVRLDDLKAFIGTDLPNVTSAKTDPPYVLMLTATTSK